MSFDPGMYQTVGIMRQNMDVLMNQIQALSSNKGSSEQETAKLDQMSTSFTDSEDKLEKKLENQAQEMKSVESENAQMKKQLDQQAQEMKTVEGELKAQQGLQGKVKELQVEVKKAQDEAKK